MESEGHPQGVRPDVVHHKRKSTEVEPRMPKELPDECPECGCTAGWYIHEDQPVSVKPDGTVSIGRKNNRRYGQKLEAVCNNPTCDAAVNLYVEAEVVRTGGIQATGAKDVIDELDEDFPIPFKSVCERCGEEFVTELEIGQSRTGGIRLSCPSYCGCGKTSKEKIRDWMITRTVADIDDPEEFRDVIESEVMTE